jgi:hypothetical protein
MYKVQSQRPLVRSQPTWRIRHIPLHVLQGQFLPLALLRICGKILTLVRRAHIRWIPPRRWMIHPGFRPSLTVYTTYLKLQQGDILRLSIQPLKTGHPPFSIPPHQTGPRVMEQRPGWMRNTCRHQALTFTDRQVFMGAEVAKIFHR